MIDTTVYERRLRLRQDELRRRLARIESDLEQPADPDTEERATEREDDEVLEHLASAGLAELRAIQEALARMAKGRYGLCLSCGKAIDARRLDALPYAVVCRDCAN